MKNLLGQVIQSPEQQYFLTRLLGFSFTIEYKRGKDNAVADALFRLPEIEIGEESTQLLELTSSLTSNWAGILADEEKLDPWIRNIITKVQEGNFDPNYTVKNGIPYFQGRFYVGPSSDLCSRLLEELYTSTIGGHSGFYRMLHRVQQCFFWKCMNKFIREFVAQCTVCQQVKSSTLTPMGLLQLLPIPIAIWEDLSMDFVTSLSATKGHSVIVVVVDRLTK